ncbi:hypothetical protein P4S68_05230 [Pseudoalteromonas sp. Hal099]
MAGKILALKKTIYWIKLDYTLNSEQFKQRFELKLAYSDELSNETYLGLTWKKITSKTPYRRYAASWPCKYGH